MNLVGRRRVDAGDLIALVSNTGARRPTTAFEVPATGLRTIALLAAMRRIAQIVRPPEAA
jgi:hypothetical protein